MVENNKKGAFLAWIVRLLRVRPEYKTLEIRHEGLRFKRENKEILILFSQLFGAEEIRGRLLDRIDIELAYGKIVGIRGIPRWKTTTLVRQILEARTAFHAGVKTIQANTDLVQGLGRWIDQAAAGTQWIAHHQLHQALEEAAPIQGALKIPANYLAADAEMVAAVDSINCFLDTPEAFRSRGNAIFVDAEIERFRDFFDNCCEHALTGPQRLAVITHEDNTRVVAAAGSGKTSVITAKAGYLLKKKLCGPGEILMISFGKAAAEEMKERIHHQTGTKVPTSTFHALGLAIITEVTGMKPSLSREAEDIHSLRRLIRSIVTELLEHASIRAAVERYFTSFFAPYRSELEFTTLGDYLLYLKSYELVTLNGEKVKSFEEAELANFLCMNGISYEYERSYEIATVSSIHRQYKPDFFLSDHEIYIEHFGVQRDGSTAAYVDSKEYQAGMAWKRNLHKEHGTTLIETFSYQKREGTLLPELREKLETVGVRFTPIPPQELLERLADTNQLDPFTRLLCTFLNHFKGSGMSVDQVRSRAHRNSTENDRAQAFLDIFSEVYNAYEERLHTADEIDFNDMILQATDYVKKNSYCSPYTCILVDEFQDISVGRAALLSAMAAQSHSNRLFCVGDDWQAIYRFAGSDIGLFSGFQDHFGSTETVMLEDTFRLNNQIERVASRFVLQNPSQIKKKVRTHRSEPTPRVIVHRAQHSRETTLATVLEEIAEAPGTHDVLVLARYNFVLRDLRDQVADRKHGLKLKFHTVHGAKGLEADYVVVAHLAAGRYGFPTEITDDPLLSLVLSRPEEFEHAEERRLFYVALTRARHAVHLLGGASESAFLAELSTYGESVEVRGGEAGCISCPACGSGILSVASERPGSVFHCSNRPYCDYVADACLCCSVGAMTGATRSGLVSCSRQDCDHSVRSCPRCGTGILKERDGKNGRFLGCSNYASDRCNFTARL
jgi:DNA helicase IV